MDYDSLRAARDDTVRDGADFDAYRRPGDLIDSQHPKIIAYASRAAGEGSDQAKARRGCPPRQALLPSCGHGGRFRMTTVAWRSILCG